MLKEKFNEILANTRNQLLIVINNENFLLNLNKKPVMNELGLIAINEITGSATIVFFNDIDSLISDGQKFQS